MIEADDAMYLCSREVQYVRDRRNRLRRDVTELVLDCVQDRQKCAGAFAMCARDVASNARLRFGRCIFVGNETAPLITGRILYLHAPKTAEILELQPCNAVFAARGLNRSRLAGSEMRPRLPHPHAA